MRSSPTSGAGVPRARPTWSTSRHFETMRLALKKSVELQSYYASLLNMHDGGERMTFTLESWMARLAELRNRSDRTEAK